MTQPEENLRVDAAYRRYSTSPGKQRSWDPRNPGNIAIRKELVDAVFAAAGDTLERAQAVLDVGCGTGWWLAELASRAEVTAQLRGFDVLPARIELARERVPTAELAVADARQMPYEPGAFDVVTMFTVLSSLAGTQDACRTLGEALRVLTPGGTLLIWEPRLPNPLNRETLLVTARLIRTALREAQIETRTLTLLPPLARRLGKRTDRLYPWLARVPVLRTHRLYVVLGR